jgi:hypothetical protein
MKIYPSARTVFQQKINNILPKEEKNSALFENIFKLQQIYIFEKSKTATKSPDNELWKILMELFNELGSVEFAKMISIVKGKTLSLPTEEEYQDSIITALCYYYKEVEGMDWKQIKERVDIKDLNNIKFGIRVQQLKGFIDEQIFRSIKRINHDE